MLVVACVGWLLGDVQAQVAAPQSPPAVANPRPNVVFILVDDLRFDTFGFMGHPFVETPHIDALAQGGLQFTQAFVTTSLCSPARASFLTGQYMHRHRVVDNSDPLPAGTLTVPQQLQKSGYQTAFIGKWHMGSASDHPQPGFDQWVSFHGQGTYAPEGQTLNVNGTRVDRQKYMTDELTDYAVQWLEQRTDQQPFLLYLSHKGVHGLYDPAPRHRDRYRNAAYEPPATMADITADAGDWPMWVRDQRNSWHGVEYPYHGRAGQSIEEMYKHYCEMILSIDDSLGRLQNTLEATGHATSTLVLFTSDGGHLWGEHGLIDKRCAYEASIRIPLLAYWPARIAPGGRCPALATNLDVAPTLLELAGIPLTDALDGRSLLPWFSDPDASDPTDQTLFYEYYWEPSFPQTPTTFALRGPRYKFIQYHGIWDCDELYDLTDDPQETKNLIFSAAHAEQVATLRQQLYAKMKRLDALNIPLGFKRNHGSSLRSPEGSRRAEFPPRLLDRNVAAPDTR